MSALVFVLLSAAEIQGYISDAACGWNNARPGKEAQECARKCVEAGWPPVLVRDGGMSVFKIEDKAERAAVRPFVGEHVTITGVITGENLRVTKIRKSPAPAKPFVPGKK
ncbi:MAG: hypothetical protein K2X03_12705 [Bryobacteraceae bacterium]|nr:hypothetical protein [Bryobacteraceae bacterium]